VTATSAGAGTTAGVQGAASGVPDDVALTCTALADQIARHTDGTDTMRAVMRAAAAPDARLDDLRQAIQADPALAAQVVRRANSPYYRLSYQAADLRQAAALLGFHELRNVALLVFLSRILDSQQHHGTFQRRRLWHHSLAVAAAGHLLARTCSCGAPADAFAAGLLHDIGYAFLDVYRHRDFGRVLATLESGRPTVDTEREVFGFDHAELGAVLADRWSLPITVADAIRHHHAPELYAGPSRETVYAVGMANYLCSRMGWTALGPHNIPAPADCVYAGLQIDALTLSVLMEELPETLERAQSLSEL